MEFKLRGLTDLIKFNRGCFEGKGEMAILMEEKDMEQNLDNLLRVPHSAGVYVLRERWSST
ncbi:hypothetical protein RG963_07020 [Methanosarcina sp. Z-7115]|uniref:Uncharacterized protein n=1 Tax=Methanosarcina baikalica TaxID=3073890 RepID=A0ABU2D0P3_9EURY|nr:hypothetical protein [Methanosarcina sp. Z-7115]MDR7665534.1 hypothetical protein [Methanosarcina sp. Z-7115]